jgi:ADP-ribose pyrophosphatase YjhB (NUDIX family)
MPYEFIEGNIETCIKPDYVQLVTVAPIWGKKVLLIYRQSEPFAGMYSIPGGHKEEETYEDGARRELREETSIKAGTLIPLTIFIDHEHKLECHGFKFVSEDGAFSEPPDEEQEVVGWKELDEALELPLTPGLYESLQRLGSFLPTSSRIS